MKHIQKFLCALLCATCVGGVVNGMEWGEIKVPTEALFDAVEKGNVRKLKELLKQARTGGEKLAFVTAKDTRVRRYYNSRGRRYHSYNYNYNYGNLLIKVAVVSRPMIAVILINATPEYRRFELFNNLKLIEYVVTRKERIDLIYHIIGSIPEGLRHDFIAKNIIYSHVGKRLSSSRFQKYVLSFAKDRREFYRWRSFL
jgi:hypothetical protein